MAGLILVPTPIGNLDDITYRAVKVLTEVDVILAEDTRKTGFLLKHLEIEKKMHSHHKFNEHNTVAILVERMQKGESFALVSDAGTPAVSDPGFLLVRECIENGVEVECLPGATAFVPALVMSGLPAERFCFEGFLPQKKGRQKRILALEDESRTIIFYESPHRIVKLLDQLADVLGPNRKASVSREISKMHEETRRGSLKELSEYFTTATTKGEFVVVVAGSGQDIEK